MIGFSLSLCVRDILAGRICVEDVQMIVSATAAKCDGDWAYLINQYCAQYWRNDPVRARNIVLLLRSAGRIFQPRIYGLQHPGAQEIWRESC